MEKSPKEAGRRAEDAAARLLKKKGLVILSRNFNTRFGELDIVAKDANDSGCIVFVEVRYRGEGSYLCPEETIGAWKQKHIKYAAWIYLKKYGLEDEFVRFDVVCVSRESLLGPVDVEHIEDAFYY